MYVIFDIDKTRINVLISVLIEFNMCEGYASQNASWPIDVHTIAQMVL